VRRCGGAAADRGSRLSGPALAGPVARPARRDPGLPRVATARRPGRSCHTGPQASAGLPERLSPVRRQPGPQTTREDHGPGSSPGDRPGDRPEPCRPRRSRRCAPATWTEVAPRSVGKGAATTCRGKENHPNPNPPLCGGQEHGRGDRSSSGAARREAIVTSVSATVRARLARAPTGIRTRRD
jgi:hypothetical protein